jgi:uncharacterized coiled-coil protein SlyX
LPENTASWQTRFVLGRRFDRQCARQNGHIFAILCHMKTTTLQVKNSLSRLHARLAFLLIPLAIALVALAPQARATCQQGCLTNQNTVLGEDALISNTGGDDNTAIGFNALFSNTDGSFNTATGFLALSRNTGGDDNTAVGFTALSLNTTGIDNTAVGFAALQVNTTGSTNTAVGQQSLQNNTTGSFNTATGYLALQFNTTGEVNTATGASALLYNTTGSANTANGGGALINNRSGINNTAVGTDSLDHNGTGSYNTAVGKDALSANQRGNQNTAIGSSALDHCKGENSSGNIALGNAAGTALTLGKNNIYVGNPGQMTEADTIRIGAPGIHTATFLAGISGAAVVGDTVVVDTNGHLGTVVSSERFKDAIKPMDKASEAILALRPVTFRYKHELDRNGIPQFGLVAEEVERVNPDLVAHDKQGKPNTVRYEAVNAMLLNEFLKEHRKVAEQGTTITELKAELRATVTRQQKQIDALTARLQKVSAQLEATKSSPQMFVKNQ